MTILITGCAGFIGFHLSNTILKKDKKIKIIGIDNLNNYYSSRYKKKRLNILKKHKNFSFFKLDISNYNKLKKVFKKSKINLIINLAAQAGVRYSISNPKEYISSNIVGFHNIAELSRLHKINRIIYASSSSVYGERKKFPLKETDDINPNNIYSLSKKNNEEIAEIYSKYYKIKFIGLRFFTIYGEWGRPDMLILKYILSTKNKKVFYLNNYGKHFRDFTYIEDAIKNILILMKKKFKNNHEIFNICSNNPISIEFILKKLIDEFGTANIKKRSKQQADVYKTHGSNSKLLKVTKYKKFKKISDGLVKTINWSRKNIYLIK